MTKKLTIQAVTKDVREHPFSTNAERAKRMGVSYQNLCAFMRRHQIIKPVAVGEPKRGQSRYQDNEILLNVEYADCFADYLHVELARLKLRHSDLQRVLGISESTVQNWRSGTSTPNYKAMKRMIKAGFDVPYLLTGRPTLTN
ncbi:hypothetical protein ACFBZI_11120 [Moraxella sp. ZJ142]|uniref:hypothetical protein n=1 Tax=Moraxella marmotae TaxID=3344520 RepID=UPI0035D4F921